MTFNVRVPSRTLDAVAESGEFNVHVLAGDASGAAVATHFTRGNLGDAAFEGQELRLEGSSRSAPLLRGEGVLFVLRCKVVRDAPEGGLVRVRDHVIVVGEVVEMVEGDSGKEVFGLAYADRRYRMVGDVLEEDE